MLNELVKANEIEVEIFSSGQNGDNIEDYQLAINSWLKSQPNNIVVHDVIYRHGGRTSRGKDIMSMVILSGPAPKGS
ncbi:hypothetical protein ACFLU1_06450 [Chloroflexota bacterium]